MGDQSSQIAPVDASLAGGGLVSRRIHALGGRLRDGVQHLRGRRGGQYVLAADLYERPDSYLIVFGAPGVESEEDIHVRYLNGDVHVRIERFRSHREGFESVLPTRKLTINGRVTLPEDATVDPENATATLRRHGTLHVELPKAEPPGTVAAPQSMAE